MGSLAPSNDKIVLISGINGYIASIIGLDLLKKGYKVRGTARKAESTHSLVHDVYKEYADRFQAVSVPDMIAPGAFDEVVKGLPPTLLILVCSLLNSVLGVYSIIHTASPIDMSLQTLDDFMVPAIGGAIGILDSALKHAGPQLESFVVTSSVAAIANASRPQGHSFTEADWNDFALNAVKTNPNAPVPLFYSASKTAAEKAVWEWRDKNQVSHPDSLPSLPPLTYTLQPPFSITAVNPGVVTGPSINPPAHTSSLNVTLKPIWNMLSGTAKTIPTGIGSQSYIDVRDVSAIHIYAAEHPKEANGVRYLAAAGRGTMQAAADILRKGYPERDIVVGEPGSDYEVGYGFARDGYKFYSTRMEEALGRGLIGFERSVLETARVLERYL